MSILDFVGRIFEPAAKLVDDIHTSKEEKMVLKAELLRIQTGILSQAMNLEKTVIESKTAIITAEAKSDSWLTKSIRPLVVLLFSLSVLAYWFGITPTDPVTGLSVIPLGIIEKMFTVVQIGLGGYITSRGAEKIVPAVAAAMKAKEKV